MDCIFLPCVGNAVWTGIDARELGAREIRNLTVRRQSRYKLFSNSIRQRCGYRIYRQTQCFDGVCHCQSEMRTAMESDGAKNGYDKLMREMS